MRFIERENDELWQYLSAESISFERSMDKLYRKQTGSYYTALDLAFAMMSELVEGLNSDFKKELFKKKFLEPCVGTGNFVFAYLKACKELNFSREEYRELLNNIYACDINSGALSIYKKNLTLAAKQWFNISLNDEYFNRHIGRGLLFNVVSEKIKYIPLSETFGETLAESKFDIVVTNPPYKNLKAERKHYDSEEQKNFDKNKYADIAKTANSHFSYSTSGTLNLYKLFVEEITERYLAENGVCSLLISSSILSDKSCAKLRTRILETCSVRSLRLIAENSSYIDASQSLCAMLFSKGSKTTRILVDSSFSGDLNQGSYAEIENIIDDTTGNAILVLSENEYRIRGIMRNHPIIKEIPYIANLRGELDITMNKTAIVDEATPYKLFRGRHVGYYKNVELPKSEYVTEGFVEKTAKQKYIKETRLVCQQIVNMAKKRRISFMLVPKNIVLANSCNFVYISKNNDGIDNYFLLGILNSELIDWYFKLTSSNNHINNYEIDNFPIPVSYGKKSELSKAVKEYIESPDEALLAKIDSMVYEAYGISGSMSSDKKNTLRQKEPKRAESIFTSNKAITESFRKDLDYIIPGVTFEECACVLSGNATVQELYFAKKSNISKFEKRVLEGIEKKYKLLFSGGILNHTSFKLSDLDLEMIRPIPQGGNWKNIPAETVQKSKRLIKITQTGGRTTLYGRIDYSKPSYTITTYFNRPGNGTYVHPIHDRVITVREAARFQCFPDDYFFCGNKSDVLNQVGNAVPVLLAYSIAKSIREKTGCQTSVDLFSGAGGMTYGFKRAGINAAIANDMAESACVTLKTNCPEIRFYTAI